MEAGVNAARSHWPRRGRWVRRPSERRMWGPTADPTVGAASAACSTRILRRFNGVTVGGREPSWLVRLAGWLDRGGARGRRRRLPHDQLGLFNGLPFRTIPIFGECLIFAMLRSFGVSVAVKISYDLI